MPVPSVQSNLMAAHRANGVRAAKFGEDFGPPRVDHELGNDPFLAQDVGQPDRTRVDLGIILVIGVLVAKDDQNVHSGFAFVGYSDGDWTAKRLSNQRVRVLRIVSCVLGGLPRWRSLGVRKALRLLRLETSLVSGVQSQRP